MNGSDGTGKRNTRSLKGKAERADADGLSSSPAMQAAERGGVFDQRAVDRLAGAEKAGESQQAGQMRGAGEADEAERRCSIDVIGSQGRAVEGQEDQVGDDADEAGQMQAADRLAGLRVNAARLEQSLAALGRIGQNAEGGLDRTAFTPAELEARAWLQAELQALGLAPCLDEAANIWAVRPGRAAGAELPQLVFGSHVDTVPNGGKYDGALGVLLALEVLRVLEEQGIRTRHPFALVSFSAEEPNPFGLSTFGSRSIAGRLSRSDLELAVNGEGIRLTDALRAAGGDPERYESCRRKPGEFSAYLEVHIEQGKRLLNRNLPIGIVTGITGIYREEVTVTGEPNHAGTTLMEDRVDALMATSELMLAFEQVCREHPADDTVGTVGFIANEPNAANIIPGRVVFQLEIRGSSRAHIQQVLDGWTGAAEEIRYRRGFSLQRRVRLDQHPVAMDPLVQEVSSTQADRLGYGRYALGSMAGHDAAHMAALTRAGMLFVPSLEGKSHCPEEASRMEDIEQAGNVLLHTLLALDQLLDVQVDPEAER